jgi:hypothetical protein
MLFIQALCDVPLAVFAERSQDCAGIGKKTDTQPAVAIPLRTSVIILS